MPNRSQTRTHYQLRLVKRIDGRKFVTYSTLANAGSTGARDKTLDVFQANNDKAALQRARDYVHRSVRRKGPLPGEFRGVVVVKYEHDPERPALVTQQVQGPLEMTNRRDRLKGTTTWLYYIDSTVDAYTVDATNHEVTDPV